MTTQMNEAEFPSTPLTAVVEFDDASRSRLRLAEHSLVVAQAYAITCAEDCQDAVTERNANLREINSLEKLMEHVLAPFKDGVDRVRGIFKPGIERRKESVKLLNSRIVEWTTAEERRVATENAAREDEARRIRQKAAQEAAAIEAKAREEIAQKQRLAREQEELRQKAVLEGNARAAREAAERKARLDEQALAAVESSAAKAQQTLLEATAAVPAPIVETTAPTGNVMRDKWVAELKPGLTEDQAKALIVAGVGSRPELLGLLLINEKAIRKQAESLHAAMDIPGYRAVNRPIPVGSKK